MMISSLSVVANTPESRQHYPYPCIIIVMPRAKKSADNWNYEASVEQVEEIITELETGELPLANIFEQFEKAITELKKCDTFLQEKQQQAQLLIETLLPEDSEE
ncbi:MAG: exodeoxyribonuclease VII small subunit [Cyanobacteria bacterium P01_F01_bin.13]